LEKEEKAGLKVGRGWAVETWEGGGIGRPELRKGTGPKGGAKKKGGGRRIVSKRKIIRRKKVRGI